MVHQPAVAAGGEEATGLARGRNAATVAQRQAAEVAALGHRPEGNGAATRRRGREHLAGGVHGGAAAVLAQAVKHRLAGIRQRDLHLLASVDRKGVVLGKSWSVRINLGGRSINKKNISTTSTY